MGDITILQADILETPAQPRRLEILCRLADRPSADLIAIQ